MILSIGEILVDMIGKTVDGETAFARYAGGAPFNVAYNLAQLGTRVGFCGRVGDDLMGTFLCDFAAEGGFAPLLMQVDPDRNTTMAFVALDETGDRSFCFCRKGTADYFIDAADLESAIEQADIVHLGSLILSEPEGRACADRVIAMARKHGKKLSFDINYRDDIFESTAAAVAIYRHYADQMDMVKYSEEEVTVFTGTASFDEALTALKASPALSFVTLGKQGSLCVWQGEIYRAGTTEVKCVDTTGAGDAFFAGALSVLDRAGNITPAVLTEALRIGNICGAVTTTAYGAIYEGLGTSVDEYLS